MLGFSTSGQFIQCHQHYFPISQVREGSYRHPICLVVEFPLIASRKSCIVGTNYQDTPYVLPTLAIACHYLLPLKMAPKQWLLFFPSGAPMYGQLQLPHNLETRIEKYFGTYIWYRIIYGNLFMVTVDSANSKYETMRLSFIVNTYHLASFCASLN